MALLSLQDASEGGVVTPVAASGGGDQVPAGSRAAGWDLGVVLIVRNGGLSSITVTVDGHDPVQVAAGAWGVVPVYGVQVGTVRNVTYSGVSSVEVAAVRLHA